jgi:hypothetical protein
MTTPLSRVARNARSGRRVVTVTKLVAGAMTTDPHRPAHPGSPSRPKSQRRSRLREGSVWLNPAPVIAAALAVFALVLGGLTVRLVAGHDPAVGAIALAPRTGSRAGRAPLITRTSGAPGSIGSRASGVNAPAPLVTSSSGTAAGGRISIGGDDGA